MKREIINFKKSRIILEEHYKLLTNLMSLTKLSNFNKGYELLKLYHKKGHRKYLGTPGLT